MLKKKTLHHEYTRSRIVLPVFASHHFLFFFIILVMIIYILVLI